MGAPPHKRPLKVRVGSLGKEQAPESGNGEPLWSNTDEKLVPEKQKTLFAASHQWVHGVEP